MAAPPKPWEQAGINSQNQNSQLPTAMSSFESTGANHSALHGLPSVNQLQPPPIPPRPSQQSALGSQYSYGGYSGLGGMSPFGSNYSSMFGGGGMGGYSPYGSYGGSYGGYSGYGMNRFGGAQPDNYTANSFVHQAEENSRVAFQSVESVVQAFGAVSMMMESTYFAVYNSFRAVLGVADQFSRVRTQLVQIFCTIALFRRLKWLLRKLLVLLRLRKANLPDDVWADARSSMHEMLPGADGSPKKSNWPIFVFVTLIVGAPWLIWKALSSMAAPAESDSWKSGETDHYLAVANYSFVAQSNEELSFKAGQNLRIAPKGLQPKLRGWLLASVDGKSTGLVPANYLKILGKKPGQAASQEGTSAGSIHMGGTVAQAEPLPSPDSSNSLPASVWPSPAEPASSDLQEQDVEFT